MITGRAVKKKIRATPELYKVLLRLGFSVYDTQFELSNLHYLTLYKIVTGRGATTPEHARWIYDFVDAKCRHLGVPRVSFYDLFYIDNVTVASQYKSYPKCMIVVRDEFVDEMLRCGLNASKIDIQLATDEFPHLPPTKRNSKRPTKNVTARTVYRKQPVSPKLARKLLGILNDIRKYDGLSDMSFDEAFDIVESYETYRDRVSKNSGYKAKE